MEYEYDGLLKTIFKDSFPEEWRDNPDFAVYLDELASFGVHKLSKEPERLSEEISSIQDQTQDLAFHNYKTFIKTAECSQELFQDFNLVEKHLDSLLNKLPDLSKGCEEFMQKSHEISSSRRINTLTLQKHPQLLEILELPQLMDTCVRNGYYEEALELTAYVKRLGKKHSNIPIILSIADDVQDSNVLMLNQLLNQLRSNIQLPTCLKVIGYLRRMNVFSESELRIKFLQSREVWFQGILSTIPVDDVYHHITKTIELSRVHLFDIITQYRAIFSDDDPLLFADRDNPDVNEASIFHGWILRKVQQFMVTLETDFAKGIDQGIVGRLDSVIGQVMYFGLSFSRVGADFRGFVAPIFEKVAINSFCIAANNASKAFDRAIRSLSLSSLPQSLATPYQPTMTNINDNLMPPHSLMEFPPLAYFCNKILSAFNDLRLCCPLSGAKIIAESLQTCCLDVVEVILKFHMTEEATLNEAESKLLSKLCVMVKDDLFPFLDLCLQSLFPASQLSTALGCSLSEVNSMELVRHLNKDELHSKLVPVLPTQEDDGLNFKIDALTINTEDPTTLEINADDPQTLKTDVDDPKTVKTDVVDPPTLEAEIPMPEAAVDPVNQEVETENKSLGVNVDHPPNIQL